MGSDRDGGSVRYTRGGRASIDAVPFNFVGPEVLSRKWGLRYRVRETLFSERQGRLLNSTATEFVPARFARAKYQLFYGYDRDSSR